MLVRSLIAGALVLVPAALAHADGCPRNPGNPGPAPAPLPQSAPQQPRPIGAAPAGTHGGSIVVLGAAQNRFEVLQDSSLGKVTVWSVAQPSSPLAVAQAPVIKLQDGRELTLVAIPGETGAWAVTDDSFRGRALAGNLMIRSSDRWETATLTLPASSDDAALARAGSDNPAPAPRAGDGTAPAPSPSTPAVPTAWTEPAAAHGGHILAACGGAFEFVRDAATGKATLYLLPQGATRAALDSDPVLTIKSATGDTRTLPMTAIAGSTNAWEVTVDVFRGDATPDGTVKVSMSGRPCELNLSDATPGNAAQNGAIALHGGRMLNLGEGTDLVRLELVQDPTVGKVTIFAPADARLDAPVLVLKTDAGQEKRITLTKNADGSWSANEDALKAASISGTVEAKVGERSLSAPLPATSGTLGNNAAPAGDQPALPNDRNGAEPAVPGTPDQPRVKTPGGDTTALPEQPGVKVPGDKNAEPTAPATTALVFGGGIAKLDLKRDAGMGRLTLTTPSDVRATRFDSAPVLVLDTPAGKKELTFEKGADEGTWTLTSDELKTLAPMKGVVRVTIEGKPLEADAAPQFADAKPAKPDMR